jgi:hypothetical protein
LGFGAPDGAGLTCQKAHKPRRSLRRRARARVGVRGSRWGRAHLPEGPPAEEELEEEGDLHPPEGMREEGVGVRRRRAVEAQEG